MTGFAFDTAILADALAGHEPARAEIRRAVGDGSRAWISRIVWIELLSKVDGARLSRTERLLSGFGIDEIDSEIAARAAALRRDRARLRLPDSVVLATALVRGRVLVTRNIKDFPAEMPGIRIPYLL